MGRRRVSVPPTSGGGAASGGSGGAGGSGSISTIFDLICGPGTGDLSFAQAMSDATALAASLGRPVNVGCRPGFGGNYIDDEVTIGDGVNVYGMNGSEASILDLQLNLASGARASLDGLSIINTSTKRALNLTGLASPGVLLLSRCFLEVQGTVNSTVEVASNATVLMKQTDVRMNAASAHFPLKQTGGTSSFQLGCRLSVQVLFDVHCASIEGGSCFYRGSALVNPFRVSGGGFAFLRDVEMNAFQVGGGRPNTAFNVGAGSSLVVRGNCDFAGATGINNPVFDGTPQGASVSFGSVDHGDFECPDFDILSGTLFNASLTVSPSLIKRGTDI